MDAVEGGEALTTKGSILVVDDHRDCREMLTEYLTRCGFVVHGAADGLEAIEIAMRIHPPIILMDLLMPRLDGWEATRRLKADARTKDITIIGVSGFSLTDERQIAREAGCDDFIPKPCDLLHLGHVLRGILDRRSNSEDSARATGAVDSRSDDVETGSTSPNLRRGLNPSLADAIAADIAFDDAIAALIERRTRRHQ
jgi:two-component system, cell cycle response regulator DivK